MPARVAGTAFRHALAERNHWLFHVLLFVIEWCRSVNDVAGDVSMQSAGSGDAVSPRHFIVEKRLSDVRGRVDARVQVFVSSIHRSFRVILAPCWLWELWIFLRIGPIRFLARCRKRRLNQG